MQAEVLESQRSSRTCVWRPRRHHWHDQMESLETDFVQEKALFHDCKRHIIPCHRQITAENI